jgi:hypothetical protein
MTPSSWKVDTSSVSSPTFADRYEDVARAYPTAGSTTRESATSAAPTISSSIAAESARAYQGFFDGLGLLKCLDEDWNGYGASPADPAAVRAAESLVSALPYDVANPLVGIAEKGSVYFKFTRAGKRYVLTIEPRKLHLLIDSGMGQYSYLDGVRFNGKNIPESVREAIMESRHA